MDKPLSQERLSDIEQSMELERYFGTHGIVRDMKWMISEIKRLQTVEAERDNFKLGLESIGMIAFGELKSGSQNKAIDTICRFVHEFLKGVEPIEK